MLTLANAYLVTCSYEMTENFIFNIFLKADSSNNYRIYIQVNEKSALLDIVLYSFKIYISY